MKYTGKMKSVLYVKDLAAVESFYSDVYGLPVVERFAGGCDIAMLRDGGIQLRTDAPDIPQGPSSLWIEAKNIDEVYAQVSKNDFFGEFEAPEDKYYHARVFRVLDPAGNAMAVVEYEKDLGTYTGEVTKENFGFYRDETRSVTFVDDLQAAYDFYTGKLGMVCVYSWDEGPGDRGFKYMLREGSNAYLETLHRLPLMPQGHVTFEFELEDTEESFAALKADPDITFLDDLSEDEHGRKWFRIFDTDGNAVVFRSASR